MGRSGDVTSIYFPMHTVFQIETLWLLITLIKNKEKDSRSLPKKEVTSDELNELAEHLAATKGSCLSPAVMANRQTQRFQAHYWYFPIPYYFLLSKKAAKTDDITNF
jgi:hypothetical protein